MACHARWSQLGSFPAAGETNLWAWAAFGAAVLGMPAEVATGQQLAPLMEDLGRGFQTLPLNLPMSPYAQAVAARAAMAGIVQQQIGNATSQVNICAPFHAGLFPHLPSPSPAVLLLGACRSTGKHPAWASCLGLLTYIQSCQNP